LGLTRLPSWIEKPPPDLRSAFFLVSDAGGAVWAVACLMLMAIVVITVCQKNDKNLIIQYPVSSIEYRSL